MNQSAAVWVLLGIALFAANLPFLNERLLLVRRPAGGEKSLAWRLLELALLYCLVGVLARFFEVQAHGSPYPQGWAFYAVTGCLFLVFAYPGFVLRYLWRGRVGAVSVPGGRNP